VTTLDSSQQLAEWLRAAREAARLTTYELAERIGITQSRTSRIERGLAPVAMELVRAWAEATGASASQGEALAREAQRGTRQGRGSVGSWTAPKPALARVLQAMTSYSEFSVASVPGLLQVPGYATAVAERMPHTAGESDVSAIVARRMNEQSFLYDPKRTFTFVISESALRYKPGPPETMRAQLEKINTVATLPNVSVAVLPCPAETGLIIQSGFAIYEAPEGSLVLVELLAGETMFTSEPDVQRYRDAFTQIRKAAVTGKKAAQIISSIGRE
jgi:transcriptional regulator with XRE-family HTH domain